MAVLPLLIFLLMTTACGGSSATSPAATTTPATTTTTTTASTTTPTTSSLAVSGATLLAPSNPASQLTATATLSDLTTQDVSGSATWQSSNSAVATVSATGLATAVANGSVTVSATYGGQAGTISILVTSFITSMCPAGTFSHGTTSARVNGVVWTATCVVVAELTPGTGVLHISGADNFNLVGQNIDVQLSAPHVGMFSNDPAGTGPILAQLIVGGSSGPVWSIGSGSGNVTVDALASSGASGSFSFSLSAATSIAVGMKNITNGVFNVTF